MAATRAPASAAPASAASASAAPASAAPAPALALALPPAPALALPRAYALALPPAPAPAPASATSRAAASTPIAAAPQPAPLGHRVDERDPDWTLRGGMRNHTVEQLEEQLERYRTWSKSATRSTVEKGDARRWYKVVHQAIKRKERSKAKAATKLRPPPTVAPHPVANQPLPETEASGSAPVAPVDGLSSVAGPFPGPSPGPSTVADPSSSVSEYLDSLDLDQLLAAGEEFEF